MLLVGAGVAVYVSLQARWPAQQHLSIRLGDVAPRTEEVRVRCARDGDGDWAREVTLDYGGGVAPRTVKYEPELANGSYVVQIEVKTNDGRVRATDHHIQLAGGTTSIDLSGGDAVVQSPSR